ncbi:MAG TPA: alpha-ketoglutarate-dependent dioxygenase AlkB [Casimicrobiaceae bacterium]|jgi:alkylated DNA repair dioxygenase AlkB
MRAHAAQVPLLDLPAELPHGLVFEHEFLSAGEETALLEWFATLPFREARFKTYYARRRVVSFHSAVLAESYDSTSDDDLAPVGPPPPLIDGLRERVAAFVGNHGHPTPCTCESFVHVLVSEYQAGTPIGWHRDKPHYGIVAGISLGSRARMRFRPVPAPGEWTRVDPKSLVVVDLEPRSIYLMRGDIRSRWQHSILPTKALRYSITMRTLADDR